MNTPWVGLGVMSGSSLDGLDIALCEFHQTNAHWHFSILQAETVAIPNSLKEKLRNSPTLLGEELMLLDAQYGKWIASQIVGIQWQIQPKFIAVHGHTVFHKPHLGYSLQIGNANHISALTGITTISDFRQQNIALGGQGAPLVPIGDQLLFKEHHAFLNLGGIANASYLRNNTLVAGDISFSNQVLNYLSQKLGKPFDDGGKIAAAGKLNTNLWTQLNALPYFSEVAPKSIGNHWIKEQIIPVFEENSASIPDKMHTAVRHIAFQTHKFLKNYSQQKVLVTGGGAYNSELLAQLNKNSENIFLVPENKIIDNKEALIFAFLGLLRLLHKENILHNYTNSKQNTSSGAVFLGQSG